MRTVECSIEKNKQIGCKLILSNKMDQNLIYRLYTITDLSEYLICNKSNGISDYMITHARAWALINNPSAKDDDLALVAVFDMDRPIGYTALFPDKLQKPLLEAKYYWGTTQWIEPEYRGKGISAKMMLLMKEAINHRYLGLDSSAASCKLDQKQGYLISYYPRYFYVWNKEQLGVIGRLKRMYVQCTNKKAIKRLRNYSYTNRFINYIDDFTYDFIRLHSQTNLFLRSKEMLNWQIHYPFVQVVTRDSHLEKEQCEFGAYVNSHKNDIVQVYYDGKLCGVYILNIIDGACLVQYLYYEEDYKENVFASLAMNVLQSKVIRFRTFNKELFDFMGAHGIKNLNSKFNIEQVSLTIPPDMEIDDSLAIQGGDGDMFC